MKRTYREELDVAPRRLLRATQVRIDAGAAARPEWKRLRALRGFEPVVHSLANASGKRQRCMYCRDSRACDVEHFVPIDVDPAQTAVWTNLLWICTDCNRRKSSRHSVQLLDPTRDDPWHHFVFVEESGEISPRWIDSTSQDERASTTLDLIPPLAHEAVTEGRLRWYRRLRSAAERWLSDPDDPAAIETLFREFREEEFGLGAWVTCYEGRLIEPWPQVRQASPAVMRRLRAIAIQ